MNLYVNGDSNMAGAEVAADEMIATHIAKFVGAANVTNQALNGASNDYIYDTTIDYLRDNDPDLVIIGWSDTGRMQITRSSDNKKFQFNALSVGMDNFDSSFQSFNNTFSELLQIGSDYSIQQCYYWHYKIFNLHNYLVYRGIKHLFFNAFEMFTLEPMDKKYHLDWGNSYYEPYKTAYVPWCLNNNYRQQTKGQYHFEPAAQKAWADKLCKHLSEHLL
jgi:hypothetical protein